MKKNFRVAVVGDAIAQNDEKPNFEERVLEAIEGCELHIVIDGIDFVITLSQDPHR